MAELALAIVGVTANGANLVKCVGEIIHSVHGAQEDAEAIRTQLNIHQDILFEVLRLVNSNHEAFSQNASFTIRKLITSSDRIYVNVKNALIPLTRNSLGKDPGPSIRKRIIWYFKKDDVRTLLAQLDSIKASLQLMISVLVLGQGLQCDQQRSRQCQNVSAEVEGQLISTGHLFERTQDCVKTLRCLENELPLRKTSNERNLAQNPGLAAEIESLICGSEENIEIQSDAKSLTTNSVTLSEQHKSIIGEQSEEVATLVEKWVAFSEFHSDGFSNASGVAEMRNLDTREIELCPSRGLANDSEIDSLPPHSLKDPPRSLHDTLGSNKDPQISTSMGKHAEVRGSSLEHAVTPKIEVSGCMAGTRNQECDRGSPTTHVFMATVEGRDTSNAMSLGRENANESTAIPLSTEKVTDNSLGPSLSQQTSVQPQFMTYTQAWLQHLDEGSIEDAIAACTGHRGPFSDVTILDHTFSPAPSVTTEMSSVMEDDDPRRAAKLCRMGDGLFKEKLYSGALETYQKAYLLKGTLSTEKILHLTFRIGLCLAELRDFVLAEKVLKYTAQSSTISGTSSDYTLEVQHMLARTLARQDKWRQANSIYAALWSSRAQVLHQPDAKASAIDKAIRTGQEYSKVLVELDQGKEALEILCLIQPEATALRGVNDKVIFNALLETGRAYCQVGQIQKGKAILDKLLQKARLSSTHAEIVGACWHELAVAAYKDQRFDDMQKLAKSAATSRTKNGLPTLSSIMSSRLIALADRRLGNLSDAVSQFQQLQQQASSVVGTTHHIVLQLRIDIANLRLQQQEFTNAETILYEAYNDIAAQLEGKSVPVHPVQVLLLEQLGPLILRNAWSLDLAKKTPLLNKAHQVYRDLYNQHMLVHGRDSTIFLQTGHDYGSLSLRLEQFLSAGNVLADVWESRTKVLGSGNPATMKTGLQLGRAQFAMQAKPQALQTLNSVFEISKLSTNTGSLETIRSAEILGYYYMHDEIPKELIRDPFDYVKAAYDARRAIHGPVVQTCESALEVALLAFLKHDLDTVQESLKYVFEEGGDANLPHNKGMLAMIMGSGLASSALIFASSRRQGNRKVQDVVDRASRFFGKTSLIAEQLRCLQALILTAQNKLSSSVDILRKVYHRSFSIKSQSSAFAVPSGVILGCVLALRALVRGQNFPDEVDLIDSRLPICHFDLTLLQLIAVIVAGLAAEKRYAEISRPLLRWVYRRQRRRYGRFSNEVLRLLAIMFVCRGLRRSSLSRRQSDDCVQGEAKTQLGQLMNQVWDACTRGLNNALKLTKTTDIEARKFSSSVLRAVSAQIAKEKLWKQFTSYMSGTANVLSMPEQEPVVSDPFSKLDCWEMPQIPPIEVDDDTISRVWTINGECEEDGEGEKEGYASLDLADILGMRTAENASSFLGSVLDLTSSDQEVIERAESCINQVGSNMINETMKTVDMDKVRSNMVDLEREAGVQEDDDINDDVV